jgi:hypothetical protein
MDLQRLEFKRAVFDESVNYLETGICTHAVEGKIFYKKGDRVYTQTRDDLPKKKMVIRCKELEQESYLHLINKFEPDDKSVSFVFMVSRQDLLITHPSLIGTQVFFLGLLNEEGEFFPGDYMKEGDPNVKLFLDRNMIFSICGYGEANSVYVPSRIRDSSELESVESFIHTKDGIPTTIFTPKMGSVFELFSDTQNNLQLFVKIFFVDRKFFENDVDEIEDLETRLEEITNCSPHDKLAQFVECIEKYKMLLEFFCKKRVMFGMINSDVRIVLNHDPEKEALYMEKPTKALKTFMKIIKSELKKNDERKIDLPLHKQVRKAIFSFFKYPRNINNCCHILKQVDRLKTIS